MTLQDKLTTIQLNTPKVHQAGKNAQMKAIWDFYQRNGQRTDYLSAFSGSTWDMESFKPMYDMTPTEADMMFFWFNMPLHPYPDEIPDPVDLVDLLSSAGVTLDFSNCAQFWRAFSYAYVSHVGVIDFKTCKRVLSTYDTDGNAYADGNARERFPTNWGGMFHGSYVETIDKLIFYHYNPSFDAKWLPEDLVNVTCEGVIVHGGLDMSCCRNITRESIMQFVNVLCDFSDDGFAPYKNESDCTVTLGADNLAKLTADDIAAATNKGWTLA